MTVASAQVLTHHYQSLVAELSAISQSSSELLLNCTALELGGSCGVLQELRDSLSTSSTMQVNEVVVTHCLSLRLACRVRWSLNYPDTVLGHWSLPNCVVDGCCMYASEHPCM